MQPFGHNRYGPKIGGLCPPFFWGSGSPFNTMWPGPRPSWMPSFILIPPAVWPRCANVTDSTDRQTDRQRSDSTGRSVLQTVAQKFFQSRLSSVQDAENCTGLWHSELGLQDYVLLLFSELEHKSFKNRNLPYFSRVYTLP